MTKFIAAAGALAFAGTAMASSLSFAVVGMEFTASDAAGFTNTSPAGFIAEQGSGWNQALVDGAAFAIPTSTLFGPNVGGAPDANTVPDWIAQRTNNAGLLPTFSNDTLSTLTGPDSSFNIAYFGAGGQVIEGERIWLAQLFTADGGAADSIEVTVFTVPAGDTTPADGPTLTLENPVGFDPISGLDIELVVEDSSVFVQVVPSPGAAALLGLAGVAGIRRRRA